MILAINILGLCVVHAIAMTRKFPACCRGNFPEHTYHSSPLLHLTSSLVRRQQRLREVMLLAMSEDRASDYNRDGKSGLSFLSSHVSVECFFHHVWFTKPLTRYLIPFLPGCQIPHLGLLTLGCMCRGMPNSSPR